MVDGVSMARQRSSGKRQPSGQRQRRGFVLLLVVILLMIVCLMLYQVASLAFAHINEGVQREKQCREQWSVVSLRRAILPRAGDVMDSEELRVNILAVEGEDSNFSPVKTLIDRVVLNNREYEIVLRDESAKLSVQALIKAHPSNIRSALTRLTQGMGGKLKPVFDKLGEQERLGRWQDVFEFSAGQNLESEGELARVMGRFTLWTDGRLNVLRADEQVLDTAWKSIFGHFTPAAIADARDQFPRDEWPAIRPRLGLRKDQLELADRYFSASSNCFSVSLRAADASGRFSSGWIFVTDRDVNYFGLKF